MVSSKVVTMPGKSRGVSRVSISSAEPASYAEEVDTLLHLVKTQRELAEAQRQISDNIRILYHDITTILRQESLEIDETELRILSEIQRLNGLLKRLNVCKEKTMQDLRDLPAGC